jgi:hypothetical protein
MHADAAAGGDEGKRMESYASEGDAAFRGRQGPLRVTNPEPRDPLFATIIKAAAEVGIRHNPDYNGASQEGIAMSQATIAAGRRMSTARCYLDPVRKRRNLYPTTHPDLFAQARQGSPSRRCRRSDCAPDRGFAGTDPRSVAVRPQTPGCRNRF